MQSRARDRISGASRLAERELKLRVQSPARDMRDRLEELFLRGVEEMDEEVALFGDLRSVFAEIFAEVFAEIFAEIAPGRVGSSA